jgi:hypothetical protein
MIDLSVSLTGSEGTIAFDPVYGSDLLICRGIHTFYLSPGGQACRLPINFAEHVLWRSSFGFAQVRGKMVLINGGHGRRVDQVGGPVNILFAAPPCPIRCLMFSKLLQGAFAGLVEVATVRVTHYLNVVCQGCINHHAILLHERELDVFRV